LDNEIDVVRGVRLARTRRLVGGDQDFGERLKRGEVVSVEELRLVLSQQRRLGRREPTGWLLRRLKPGGKKLSGPRQSRRAHGKIEQVAARQTHATSYRAGRASAQRSTERVRLASRVLWLEPLVDAHVLRNRGNAARRDRLGDTGDDLAPRKLTPFRRFISVERTQRGSHCSR